MPGYNPKTIEQSMKLPDRRRIYKTHNGFKYFVMDKKGISTQVTEEYYLKAKRTKTKNNARNNRKIQFSR